MNVFIQSDVDKIDINNDIITSALDSIMANGFNILIKSDVIDIINYLYDHDYLNVSIYVNNETSICRLNRSWNIKVFDYEYDLDAIMLKDCDYVFAISESTKSDMIKTGKYVKIYNLISDCLNDYNAENYQSN